MSISTHVLDAATGLPAVGVPVELERSGEHGWQQAARRVTDDDGRVADLAADSAAGLYRIRFDTGDYLGPDAFYPEVTITVRLADPDRHLHVPLLLSPFAYSTYRGS